MFTYIFYDDTGRILRTEYGPRRMTITGNVIEIEADTEIRVNYESEKVVDSKIVNRTAEEIENNRQIEENSMRQKIVKKALEMKEKYLLAKQESPAIVDLLKQMNIIPRDMDELIKE